MVTTAFSTDATPASFASNVIQRNQYEAIAQQYFDYFDDDRKEGGSMRGGVASPFL